MKKLIALGVLVGAAALVFAKFRSGRSDSDLWHDATTSG
jgi:hypothetical protein